ncbi:Alpha/Beta hydrolase protein [Cladorrhinum samala]|uniref:Alpha/Beta hydrolase protein n=1 Tax=Cladorrhinum samala TaxID=585594 RepID=A0AAV9HHA9_9PEZI|nr:Alpha/Beta hydrolase protein [Cladorrhinum samala]
MASQTPISPARLLSKTSHVLPGALHVTELHFEVPLDHASPSGQKISLFARSARKDERPIVPFSATEKENKDKKPYIVYLEGGPGFGCSEPQDHSLTRHALDRGYQVLFLDYRGTGLSTRIDPRRVGAMGSPEEQARYLSMFRADSIVKDLEAVRLCLTSGWELELQTWSIFGQSFGGFVCLSYLSKYPQGLREVFMTGGLAPIKRTPEEVYLALYKKVIERNEAYYKKYPEDISNVKAVARHILTGGPGQRLPGGGYLTIDRLLGLGMSFGLHGGIDAVHSIILSLAMDLKQYNAFSTSTLMSLERQVPLDANPIYAFLHEPIYCAKPGDAANHAAFRAGQNFEQFSWLRPGIISVSEDHSPLYFSGEMIYPSYYSSYPELEHIKDAAQILAQKSDWPELYDEDQLRRNEVPVFAVSFVDDMYVDFEFARETARIVKGIQVSETNRLYHNALRARSDEIFAQLFKMRDEELD